jgi:hypothetical protein
MTRGFSQHYQRLGTQSAREARERKAVLSALEPRNEAELRATIRDCLRQMGWMVRDLSQRRRVEGGLADMPDIVAFKHGRTLMIETKHGRNDLRDGQREFAACIEPHCNPQSLIYCTARSMDDVLVALGLA